MSGHAETSSSPCVNSPGCCAAAGAIGSVFWQKKLVNPSHRAAPVFTLQPLVLQVTVNRDPMSQILMGWSCCFRSAIRNIVSLTLYRLHAQYDRSSARGQINTKQQE